ncbi:MAG: hypothetical protein BGO05_05210 [Rhizobiales bacterium 63-7]|nr:hypothetical protein [Hyphomicrobiales bacterium]OJU66603.1 MAG: hypothetical protein BGO05_05210 [Rhizobiales bacterium 63-7]
MDAASPKARRVRDRTIRTASPILRAVFMEMDARGMADREIAEKVNKNPKRISEYRCGKVEPGVMSVEHMAGALGFRLGLIPIEAEDG